MVSSPKPPDPYKTANAQGAANREAAEASAIIGNVNERNPYGSVTYNKIGEELVNGKPVSRYERVTDLSPEQQNLLDLQNKMQGNLGNLGVSQSERLQGLLGTNLDTEGLTPWQTYQQAKPMQTEFADVGDLQRQIGAGQIQNTFGDVGGPQRSVGDGGEIRQDQGPTDRAALEEAMLGRYRERSGRDRAAQDAALAARGLNPGASQYADVLTARNQQDVDAYQQAYLASGQESRAAQDAYNRAQEQRYGQGVTSGQFANQAQAQAFQQEMARAGFANEAQQQDFMQKAAQGEFANAAQEAAYRQAMERASFANAGNQQDYANMQAYVDAMNALRGQQLGERQTIRNAPINEISALMGGSQVTVPQFQGYNSPSVNSVPIGDYINQNYNIRAQQAAAKNQGLFGLGSSLLTAGFGAGGFFR